MYAVSVCVDREAREGAAAARLVGARQQPNTVSRTRDAVLTRTHTLRNSRCFEACKRMRMHTLKPSGGAAQ